MKYQLAATAMAAVLALSTAAFAQAMTPGAGHAKQSKASATVAAATEGRSSAKMTRHHAMRGHGIRHASRMGRGSRGGQGNDNVADQLNRDEASRQTGSSMPAGGPPPAGNAGAMQNSQPNMMAQPNTMAPPPAGQAGPPSSGTMR